MIVINVGFGMPGGGDILVMNDNNGDMEHQRIAHSVKNKIYEVPTTNAITEPVTHFNYLLNLSFDVEESPETKKAEASLNAMAEENGGKNTTKDRKPDVKVKSDRDCISIVFEVYSIGWFGRYYLEDCQCKVPVRLAYLLGSLLDLFLRGCMTIIWVVE